MIDANLKEGNLIRHELLFVLEYFDCTFTLGLSLRTGNKAD